MEMTTMSTATKANAGLEVRPLEEHELEIVSGASNPGVQPFSNAAQQAFSAYELWGMLEPINSPVNTPNWVGKLG
jgi:hypothetical protein